MTQTYCTVEHLRFVLSDTGLTALLDDDESGVASVAEEVAITTAINWAAADINAAVGQQYKLADVVNNTWLQKANAFLAVDLLSRRRRNPTEETGAIGSEVKRIREWLLGIQYGRNRLPEQNDSFDYRPAVSNFVPVLGARNGPILVDVQASTGSDPVDGVTRNSYPQYGPWW